MSEPLEWGEELLLIAGKPRAPRVSNPIRVWSRVTDKGRRWMWRCRCGRTSSGTNGSLKSTNAHRNGRRHARGCREVQRAVFAHIWQQGYRYSDMEWNHIYDGHTIDPDGDDSMCVECGQGNPYEQKESQ